jgi:hypothetical protein
MDSVNTNERKKDHFARVVAALQRVHRDDRHAAFTLSKEPIEFRKGTVA